VPTPGPSHMKHTQDKTRRDAQYAVGDWIWLRVQQWSAVGVTFAAPSKLGPKFYGPYQILQRIGDVSYKVQLPTKARIHDMFHVALLKKFEGEVPPAIVHLPEILNGKVLPTPATMVKAQLNTGVWELLVQWVGRSASNAS
jgi:hypothetical protein